MAIIVREKSTGKVLQTSRDYKRKTGGAVQRPTSDGGSVIVTAGGQVTVKDAEGNVIERYQTSTSEAEKFVEREGDVVKQQLEEQKRTSGTDTGLYAEITPEGVQPDIYRRDSSSSFSKTDSFLTAESVQALEAGSVQPQTQERTGLQDIQARRMETITAPNTVSAGGERKSFLGEVTGEFVSGFSGRGSQSLSGDSITNLQTALSGRTPSGEFARTDFTGRVKQGFKEGAFVGGVVARFYTGGKLGSVSNLKSFYNVASTSKIGKTAVSYGVSTVGALGIVESSKQLSVLNVPKEERSFVRSGDFKASLRRGYEEEFESKGAFGKVGYSVSQFITSKRGLQAYRSGVRTELLERGFTPSEAERGVQLALNRRTFVGSGEIASLLFVSRQSEVLGRKLTSGATFTGVKGFFQSGARIGVAGFQEGFSQDLAQASSRESPLEVGRAVKTGALGFASAGVIGGAIVTTPEPISKSLQTFSYITDPYEKAGDVLAGISLKGGLVNTFTPSVSRTRTRAVSGVQSTPVSFSPAQTFVSSRSATTNFVVTPTSVSVPTVSETNIFTPVSTSTTVSTPTSVFTTTSVETPVTTETPVSTSVNTNVPTSVNTNVPTSVNTNVFTPNLKVPAIPFLRFGGGFSGFGRGRKGLRVKQPKGYNPSLTAVTFSIKGSPTKLGTISGLGVRPIK